MQCKECGKDYPSKDHFAVREVCNTCFAAGSPEKSKRYQTGLASVLYKILRVVFFVIILAALLLPR